MRLLGSAFVLFAISTNSTRALAATEADRLLKEANRYAWVYNFGRAGPLFAEAEKLYAASGDTRNALYAGIGRLRSEWERLAFPDVSRYLGDQLGLPLVQNDPELRLWILEAKGSVDLEVDPTIAASVYEEAKILARQLGSREREERANGELGIIAFLQGENARSLDLVGGALRASIELRDVGAHIRYLNLLGDGLVLFGRPGDAIQYFDRALQLVRATPELDTSTLAVMGKARALAALNKRAEAEKLFQETLSLARSRDRRGLAAALLIELGSFAESGGQRDQAVAYFEEAVGLCTAGQFYRLLAQAMFHLARIHQARGDLPRAEECAEAGLEASKRVGERFEFPKRLATLARIQAARGEVAGAAQLYEEAEDAIDALLVSTPTAGARSSLIDVMSQVYLEHVDLVLDRMQDWSAAFAALERARGRTIADLIREKPQAPGAGSRTPAAAREIADLQIRLLRTRDRQARRVLLDSLFEAEQRYGAEAGAARNPIAADTRPVDMNRLRSALRPDEVLLEYALHEPRSHCLVISRDSERMIPLARRAEIEQAVDEYLAEVRAQRPAIAASKRLFGLLLRPAGRDLRSRIIIVPDGKLHLLPFDALVATNGAPVVRSRVVTYAPSATVFQVLRSISGRSRPPVPLIAVGAVPYGSTTLIATKDGASSRISRGLYDLSGDQLHPLRYTTEELAFIGRLIGNRAVLLEGQQATEGRLKAQPLAQTRVLHLAVHGIASTGAPDRAALVLGTSGMPGEDGLLQAREIALMRLNADLVTLSACDSGTGRLMGQEGIANLVRAFLLGGARNVVSSLWGADDAFTTALMKRFYTHAVAGEDLGQALRSAKVDMLERFGPDAVPAFWAGFTLVGEGRTSLEIRND
jgi:CHAT domain-containing protein